MCSCRAISIFDNCYYTEPISVLYGNLMQIFLRKFFGTVGNVSVDLAASVTLDDLIRTGSFPSMQRLLYELPLTENQNKALSLGQTN